MKLLEKYEKYKEEIEEIKETLIKELELSFSETTQKPEQKGENWEKEEQGEYGEYYYIVKYENYFIKLTWYSDSYGDTDWNKKSIQFVTPVVKTITNYVEI